MADEQMQPLCLAALGADLEVTPFDQVKVWLCS